MSDVHQCAECGRYHCPACEEAYANWDTRKGLHWMGHEPDGEIEHMVMKVRDAPWDSPRFRMCEA